MKVGPLTTLPMPVLRATHAPSLPLDGFVSTRGAAGEVAGKGFTKVLDIRVPTTTPSMTDERRQKILDCIQPGDILLETNNAYPNWQRLEMATLRSSYTHAAMYEGNGKFLEATTGDPSGAGVVRSDLKDYLEGPILVAVLRPPYKTPADRDAAVDYCRSQLGKAYDSSFRLDESESLYCAELVYRALKACPNPIDTPTRKAMGRDAVGPDDFYRIAGTNVVYDDGSHFWKNMASHWPVALTAAVTAATAGAMYGPAAGVAGFAGGLLTAIVVGNGLQTGNFGLG